MKKNSIHREFWVKQIEAAWQKRSVIWLSGVRRSGKTYLCQGLDDIVSAPKVYGFDSGFVCFARGWTDLRKEDLGYLWEHVVLNELQGQLQTRNIRYWRDKQDHEIDFAYSQSYLTQNIY